MVGVVNWESETVMTAMLEWNDDFHFRFSEKKNLFHVDLLLSLLLFHLHISASQDVND